MKETNQEGFALSNGAHRATLESNGADGGQLTLLMEKAQGGTILSFNLLSQEEVSLVLEVLKATGWTLDCTYTVQAWETVNEVTEEVQL